MGRGHNAASAIGGIDFKKLLVASDFSNDSEHALRYGLSLAQEYQSQLHLLHVMADSKTKGTEIEWISDKAEGPYHEAARQLHNSVPAETHLWCDVTHVVREGRAYREIVSYAHWNDDIAAVTLNAKTIYRTLRRLRRLTRG